MPNRIEAKKQLIRDFREKVGKRKALLETYLSGQRRTFGSARVETTQDDIVRLQREIAAQEKEIAKAEGELRALCVGKPSD